MPRSFFSLRFWVCKLMFLGISLVKRRIASPWYQISNGPGRSEKYCFAPLLMGWKIRGETPRKRRRLRCNDVRTFSREDFFGCFIHQNNTHHPIRSPKKTGNFFSVKIFEHTNPTGEFAPVDSPKFMPPKKPWRVHCLFQNNSFKGRKLGSGVTFFFSRNPPKKGTITADLWGMYGMYIPFFHELEV